METEGEDKGQRPMSKKLLLRDKNVSHLLNTNCIQDILRNYSVFTIALQSVDIIFPIL